MNLKIHILKVAALFCVCLLPKVSYGAACSTATVATLLGTSCSIGDVNYAFSPISSDVFDGISAADITLTPDGSDPLNPQFFLTPSSGGPFSVTDTGSVTSLQFDFVWFATILTSGLQFASGTGTLVNPVVPSDPNLGIVSDNFGATVQTDGPNTNPATDPIIPGPHFDDASGLVFAVEIDGLGAGVTTSVDSFENQYHLTPTPEPSSLLLFGAGLLGLAGIALRKLGS